MDTNTDPQTPTPAGSSRLIVAKMTPFHMILNTFITCIFGILAVAAIAAAIWGHLGTTSTGQSDPGNLISAIIVLILFGPFAVDYFLIIPSRSAFKTTLDTATGRLTTKGLRGRQEMLLAEIVSYKTVITEVGRSRNDFGLRLKDKQGHRLFFAPRSLTTTDRKVLDDLITAALVKNHAIEEKSVFFKHF